MKHSLLSSENRVQSLEKKTNPDNSQFRHVIRHGALSYDRANSELSTHDLLPITYHLRSTVYYLLFLSLFTFASFSTGMFTSPALAQPCLPTLLGSNDTPAFGVYVSGSTAYMATGDQGLMIIDVSNPAVPALLGSYNTPILAIGVYVSGSTAYVAGSGGLQIIDVTNPAAPALFGSYDTPALGVYVSGSTAYVADIVSGLQIIDVSNPAAPVLLGNYVTPDQANGVYVSGSTAYVADRFSGLQIIDVSNPAAPALLGSYDDTPDWANGVYVSGSTAYVAYDLSGLQIIDVTNPAAPALLGSYDTPDAALGVYVSGSTAYVADVLSGLQIIDVSGCGENCTNGIDDDGDGLVDCEDPDCDEDPACTTTVCQCPAGSLVGCISGTVTNRAGEPLANKKVKIRRKGRPRFKDSMRTDNDGCYSFTALQDGIYKVKATGRPCRGGAGRRKMNISGGEMHNNVNLRCRR